MTTTMIEPRPGVPVPSDLLIGEWIDTPCSGDFERFRKAAAWGADQQLRLCVEWLAFKSFNGHWIGNSWATELESAMRPEPPKPPTLKEQALDALNGLYRYGGSGPTYDIIRRALETLP